MTPEERIAQLEAELARERARADGLQEIVHALTVKRRSSGAERQARYRERHTVTSSVTSDVTVTRTAPSPSLPPPFSSPSLSAPISPPPISSPNPSSPRSALQGTPSPSPDFELTSPTSKKRSRKPSDAEAMFAKIQATREARCVEVGEPVVQERWDVQRQNKAIGEVLRDTPERQALFEAAWSLYLADDGMRAKTPAWSLSYFMSSGVRAKYETRAAREEAA